MKDSAGYGSITITKAVSIVGDGSLAGILASSGQDAITINAGASDVVELRGLKIEGRDALRQLIEDVQSGSTDFTLVLVYDVSR